MTFQIKVNLCGVTITNKGKHTHTKHKMKLKLAWNSLLKRQRRLLFSYSVVGKNLKTIV